jgi:hypothetical protein
MKYLSLLILFTFLLISRAQRTQKGIALTPAAPVTPVQALSGSLNTHVFQLTEKTVLYRRLRDTLGRHYSKKLLPGVCVVLQATQSRWVKVNRAKNTRQFSADTNTYYMPIEALKRAKTYVLL